MSALHSELGDLPELGSRHLYPNYRQAPIAIVRGEGSVLWDSAGNRYLDMLAGVAVSALGHAHPKLVAAIADQAARVIQVSNYYYNEPNVRLAAKLCALTGMERAFFCNSGTEAIEASLKLTRRYFHAQGQPERFKVLAFTNSFHGRTLGSLAVTGQGKYQEGFGPLPGALHVPFGDLDAVKRALGPEVAAVIVEPVQGEGGVLPAPDGFLRALRSLTKETGTLLIADEIQTGIGRTGTFLACEKEGVLPDIVALAKGLAGGVPVGACVVGGRAKGVFKPGNHGSTFGGNQLAMCGVVTTLDTVREEGLLENAAKCGAAMLAGLTASLGGLPGVVEVRGMGLMIGIELDRPCGELVKMGLDAGLVFNVTADNVVRLLPALVISESEAREVVERLVPLVRAFLAQGATQPKIAAAR